MANKINSIQVKEREFKNLQFYYNHNTLGVKIGIQFFKIVQDYSTKKQPIEKIIAAVENGEIQDVNDLYAFVRRGYTMSPTSLDTFMNNLKTKQG